MRIGWSPSVILVPLRGPAVTTRVRGPRWPRFLVAAARGGTAETRPARPPKRSARTTRKAAKMNSHRSRRKPKRKTCRTISAVIRAPRPGPWWPAVRWSCVVLRPRSRAVLPVDEDRVADADDVAVGQGQAADAPAVDQRPVGRAEILDGGRAAVQDDVHVLAADAGVGQPDVGLGPAADHVAPGGQLVAGARPVDDEHVRDPGARTSATDDGGALLAGVGGDAAAQRREWGERRVRCRRRRVRGRGDRDVLSRRRAG